MPPQRFAVAAEVPGLAARRIAADILDGVLHRRRTLDDQLEGAGAHPGLKSLADRDRALMRRLVATILRRLGTLGHLLSRLLDRGVPTDAPRAQSALLIGAAQILWMDVPDHAAVDLSVRLVQSDRRAARFAGLVNAVLRRCAREGKAIVDEVRSQTLDVPPWLLTRWIAHYGEATARAMAEALSHEPSLDLTVKADASGKEAVSVFKPVQFFGKKASLVEVSLETGRTHQIRVHLNSIGLPVAGDPVYGRPHCLLYTSPSPRD